MPLVLPINVCMNIQTSLSKPNGLLNDTKPDFNNLTKSRLLIPSWPSIGFLTGMTLPFSRILMASVNAWFACMKSGALLISIILLIGGSVKKVLSEQRSAKNTIIIQNICIKSNQLFETLALPWCVTCNYQCYSAACIRLFECMYVRWKYHLCILTFECMWGVSIRLFLKSIFVHPF